MTPTFTHGKLSQVLINGYDVSAYFKTVGVKASSDTAETSTIGNTAKSYVSGLKDGTVSLDGYNDTASTGIGPQLEAILGIGAVVTYLPVTDALGMTGLATSMIENDVEVTSDVGAAVTIKATGQTVVGLEPTITLHPLGVEATGSAGTGIDNGAATSNGAAGYLQTTDVGTTGTVTIQDSADGVTYADLIVFTATTTPNHAERLTVAGTVREYLRAKWTETGSTLTFHLAVCRY